MTHFMCIAEREIVLTPSLHTFGLLDMTIANQSPLDLKLGEIPLDVKTSTLDRPIAEHRVNCPRVF
jgi:hypothetical protein